MSLLSFPSRIRLSEVLARGAAEINPHWTLPWPMPSGFRFLQAAQLEYSIREWLDCPNDVRGGEISDVDAFIKEI